MNIYLRAFLAIVVGLLVAWLLLTVVSSIGAGWLWSVLPGPGDGSIEGVPSPNTNTSEQFPLIVLPIALCGGLIAGALVWDPKVAPKTEMALIIGVFFILAAASGVNFWAHDALIHVTSQMVIDFILAGASLGVLTFLFRWKPSRLTATLIQRLGIFVVAVFGFALPLFYGSILLLEKLGQKGLGEFPDWLGAVTAVLGLLTAFAPSLFPKKKDE